VNKKPRVVFLESQEGTETLFTRGLRTGALGAGWEAELIFLADSAGNLRSDKAVRIDLLTREPDAIVFLMDAPLHLEHLWDAPSLAPVEKVSLWFDDYFRSPKTLARPDVWTHWQKVHGVRAGIWDEYWRCKWKVLTGVEAFPVHLAADPRLLRPHAEPWNAAWSNRAAFVGTIPSLHSMEEVSSAFTRPIQRLLEEVCSAMQTAAWPIRPYELAQKCQSFLAVKYRIAIEAGLRDPACLALWHQLLWRWGKRTARLRGLAALGKAGPLAILSGHGSEKYAGEEELRQALPGVDLVYADVRALPPASWKNLFRTGKFQTQITDPQSIGGGLPFRVFECGACGVPLLSDARPELTALFPAESGLVTAADEAALSESATKLFGASADELRERGQTFLRAFQTGHTWQLRWRELVQNFQIRQRTSVFTLRRHHSAAEEMKLRQPA
jgi:hypothetical protein